MKSIMGTNTGTKIAIAAKPSIKKPTIIIIAIIIKITPLGLTVMLVINSEIAAGNCPMAKIQPNKEPAVMTNSTAAEEYAV